MATPTKQPATKIPAGPLPSGKAAPLSANETTPEDRKLLHYVRTNARQIVAAIAKTASDAGQGREWSEMSESLQMAHTLAGLTGVGQVETQTVAAGR